MSYNSKYTGQQVEALLDIVSQGGGTGGEGGEVQKTTEAEILAMGFTKNQGTITEVKMNGVSKGTSGVVDLGTVITEHQDISGKQDVIPDIATIREGAEKGATALQEHQQLKTINGESIVGSGNIVIESGSGGSSGDSKEKIYIFDCGSVTEGTLEDGLVQDLYDNYKIIGFNYDYILYLGRVRKVFFRGTYMISVYSFFPLNGINFQYTLLLQSSDNTWSLSTSILGAGLSETHLSPEDYQYSLLPNVLYVWDEVESLELSFDEGTEGAANEYLFQFTSGSTPTTLTLPDTIQWVEQPNIEANKTYQVSVVNNIGLIVGV